MSAETKGPQIVARSFFKDLRAQGYTPKQIIGVATELLDLVTTGLRDEQAVPPGSELTKLPEDLRPSVS